MFAASRQHAAKMRDFYDAYISVGFTPEEAMEMVKIVLAAAMARKQG